MKLLFDQNISHRIVKQLPEQFLGSSSVKDEGLVNDADIQVWQFAKRNNFTIVTQDADFNDLNLMRGFPPKIIWIRTGNLKTEAIVGILSSYQSEIDDFLRNDEFGCFEILQIKNR